MSTNFFMHDLIDVNTKLTSYPETSSFMSKTPSATVACGSMSWFWARGFL